MNIHVLMTCFNRVDHTRRALSSLESLSALLTESRPGTKLQIFVTDDGSTDGTSEMIANEFAYVNVGIEDGTLFWNRGMAAAYSESLLVGVPDLYLLVNDDVDMDLSKAVGAIDSFVESGVDVIVGPTNDWNGGLTYGGFTDSTWVRPFYFPRVPMSQNPSTLKACDTFNANFVLINGRAMTAVGGFDTRYEHALGDLDLGLRLTRAGYKCAVFGEYVGRCEKGAPLGDRIAKASFQRRFELLFKHPNSFSQYVYFVRHNKGLASATLYLASGLVSRFKTLLRPRSVTASNDVRRT